MVKFLREFPVGFAVGIRFGKKFVRTIGWAFRSVVPNIGEMRRGREIRYRKNRYFFRVFASAAEREECEKTLWRFPIIFITCPGYRQENFVCPAGTEAGGNEPGKTIRPGTN